MLRSTRLPEVKRRVPFWITFVPLIVGVAGYYALWSGYADAFRTEVAALLRHRTVTIGGFPYRVAVSVEAPALSLAGPGLSASVSAAAGAADRGPWRPELTVVRLTQPRLRVAVTPIDHATFALSAPAALSSVHLARGRLVRLSTVFDHPRFSVGFIPGAISADRLEVHLRETPTDRTVAAATPPVQSEVVLAGSTVRIAGGDPVALAATIGITATAPLHSVGGWANGGTVEITHLTLTDASGEVLALAASGTAANHGNLQLAGTIDTVCPASVAAAFAGLVATPEVRLRRPVRLSFNGLPGALALTLPETTRLDRRKQLPPCPLLRR